MANKVQKKVDRILEDNRKSVRDGESFFANKLKVGDYNDPSCRQTVYKIIARKVCRNNCKYWIHEGKRKGHCGRGHGVFR